jgi:hypothetical protein
MDLLLSAWLCLFQGFTHFWAVLWYALVLAAFGIAPQLPAPAIAVAALATVFILGVPVARWVGHPAWSAAHRHALVSGALLSAMAVSFFGFQGGSWADIAFKAMTNIVATVLLLSLRRWPYRLR